MARQIFRKGTIQKTKYGHIFVKIYRGANGEKIAIKTPVHKEEKK